MKKNKQKKKRDSSKIFGLVALGIFAMAMVLTVIGMSQTVSEIDKVAISHSPDVILANAGVADGKDVFLSVMYFDERSDECVNMYDMAQKEALEARQFEWSRCGYHNKTIEKGLVEYELGEDYLPVAKGGNLTPNRGLKDLTRWFDEVEGKSANYIGNLKLDYKADGAEFSFYQSNFYPLDEVKFSDGDIVNEDGHNHLFTMNFVVPFTVLKSGNERFEITADDDTFVFVGNKLAIDMGGIHNATTGHFEITEAGEVYAGVEDEDLAYTGINVEDGDAMVRIFHADRDSDESVFKIKFAGMNLGVTDAKLANRKGDGLQIAYDPTDPTYVAPLGESSVVKPDGTKGFMIMATIEGVLIVVLAVFLMVSIKTLIKKNIK
ncbi:fibro-slime domain-containing protein [Candidatus Saccharibacteria bacterium]|nr:fibro-slime domain-containing protein [Candidatus Saccharibacteria bacterium]